jgi:tetratricopeptide (TPR) repeat protein
MKYSLVFSLPIALICFANSTVAKTPLEVSSMAKAVTIEIKLKKSQTVGSGVLIARQGDLYTMVTNRHVVCGNRLCSTLPTEEMYSLGLLDGQKYQVSAKNIKLLGNGLDLAIVQFRSSRSYPVAAFADRNSLKVGDQVYTAGYPFEQPGFKFAGGQAVAVLNKRLTADGGGYTFIYDASTLPGMSGGGVFNKAGQLVAIHGQGDRFRENTRLTDSSRKGATITASESVGSKIGYNRGIPIRWVTEGLRDQGIVVGDRLSQENNTPATAVTADEYFITGFNQWVDPGDDVQDGKRAALRAFSQAIKINYKYFLAYFMRGYVYTELQEYPQALADFSQVIKLQPRIAGAYGNRGLIRAEKMNDFSGAMIDYNQAIALDSESAHIFYNNRGILKYYSLNDFSGALADYNQAIKLAPTFALPYNNRGLLKKDKFSDLPGALADYKRAIALKPDFAMAYYNRGDLRESLNDPQAALSDYDRAIELNPKYVAAYNSRGFLKYQKLNNDRGAMADFNRAIAINPQSAAAYHYRGNLKQDRLNDFAGALADYDRSISIDAKSAYAYSSRAKLKANRLQDYQGALADYDRAISLDGKVVTVYLLRGSLKYEKFKNPKGAVADYNQAILVDPKFVYAYILRGFVKYSELGDRPGGIADLRQAVSLARTQRNEEPLRIATQMLRSWGIAE